MNTILPSGDAITRTFLMPASIGPGGRAFIKGMALAAMKTWGQIGDIDPGVVRQRFMTADDIGEKVINGIRYLAMIGVDADPRTVPHQNHDEEMLEVYVPAPAGLDQTVADEILFAIERMGIQAANGMREDERDPDLPGAGFWKLLFGPDSDPISLKIGRASATLGDQLYERFQTLMMTKHNATSVPFASCLMACMNMAMTISVVANEEWPELAAAVRACLEDEDLIPTRPAGGESHPALLSRPAPKPRPNAVKPRETMRDEEWNAIDSHDNEDRSNDMTPAAMVAAHSHHIAAHELIMLSDNSGNPQLEKQWHDYESEREAIYEPMKPLAPYNSERDGSNPLAEEALSLISNVSDKVRDTILCRSAELIDRPGSRCKYIPDEMAQRHREARSRAYALESLRGYQVHVVARGKDIDFEGQTIQVWMTLNSKDEVEPEIRDWVHLHDWTISLVLPGDKLLADDPDNVVAYASGSLLSSFSSDAAFEACDMVGGEEVDFHKALHEKILEPAGCHDLEEWTDETHGENAAIHLEEIRISPLWRGKGMLQHILQAAQSVGFAGWWRVNAKGGWAYVSETDRLLYGDNAEQDEDMAWMASQNEVSSHARAIVVPIIGTRRGPEIVDSRAAALMRNSRQGPVAAEIDPRIEARRVKLTEHFSKVLAQITDDWAIYDPWEYPVT